jgi:protein-ribulosamine 3-kinase
MNHNLIYEIEHKLRLTLNVNADITNIHPYYGGSFAQASIFHFQGKDFFLKSQPKTVNPSAFIREAEGLTILRNFNEICIPEVFAYGQGAEEQYIVMEYITTGKSKHNFWEQFGRSQARMHKHHSDYFGFETDNYIGRLPQSNQKHKYWIDFFINERLEPQLKLAQNKHLLNTKTIQAFQNLYQKLNEIFPVEVSSIVHGDLWSGNYLVTNRGEACLIDPACYYGFREMDLAMTKLFGGFSQTFYDAYNNEYPLYSGYSYRYEICNLYPLLVHLNLFGSGYRYKIESVLKPFIK